MRWAGEWVGTGLVVSISASMVDFILTPVAGQLLLLGPGLLRGSQLSSPVGNWALVQELSHDGDRPGAGQESHGGWGFTWQQMEQVEGGAGGKDLRERHLREPRNPFQRQCTPQGLAVL